MNLRKRGLALLMCICMVFTLLPFSAFAENDAGGIEGGSAATPPATLTYPAVWMNGKQYDTLDNAMENANDGDTIYLGEGTYSGNTAKPTEQGKGAGKSLTFVGAGTGETTWQIMATKQYNSDGWCDYSFRGSDAITFKNMTVVGSVSNDGSTKANYMQGLTYINHITLENCVFNGLAHYWGYETTTFNNVTFNAPGTEASGISDVDYSLWTWTGTEYTFNNCTFNSAGKVINVYHDTNSRSTTVNFNNCTVNSSDSNSLSVMNINDSLVEGFTINFTGNNTITGIKADGIAVTDGSHASKANGTDTGYKTSTQATCSKLFEFNMKYGNGNTGKTVVNIDGTTVWKDGKMVSHNMDTADGSKLYTDGYKDDAFTSETKELSDRTVTTRTCKYCGWKEESTVYNWDVSCSKTATELDENYQSNVTLSLPSATTENVIDVVFVVDNAFPQDNNTAAVQARALMEQLKEVSKSEFLDVNVGLVISGGYVPILDSVQLGNISDTNEKIQKFLDMSESDWKHMNGRKGSNIQAGIEKARDMLNAETTASKENKFLILISDGGAFSWYDKDTNKTWAKFFENYEAYSKKNYYYWCNPGDFGSRYTEHGETQRVKRSFSDLMTMDETTIDAYSIADPGTDAWPSTNARGDKQYEGHYAAEEIQSFLDAHQGEYAESAIVNDLSNDYVTSREAALYHTTQSIKAASDEANVIFVSFAYYYTTPDGHTDSNLFRYTEEFKNYLEDNNYVTLYRVNGDAAKYNYPEGYDGVGETEAVFESINKDLIYLVDAGSTVVDTMGTDFDFVSLDTLKLTVGGTELAKKIDGNAAYFASSDDKLNDEACSFKVVYDSDTDSFTWYINEAVTREAPVQLTYTVKLTNVSTTPGDHGQLDLDGDGYIDETNTPVDSSKALYTNKSAVLTPIDSNGNKGLPVEFPKPSLAYTVEKPYTPPTITPIRDKITVEITGNSDSVVYDGTEHSVKDYTVKISDSRYTEKDFTFSGTALASGVNAGTYEMGLKADQFKNTNARFTNVEFVIKADGALTITQRPLTITAGSAEGIAPVTCDEYTVEGLATGDKVDSVKITGIQSEPGESPNVASDAVIKNAKGEDVTASYKITYVNGVLKAIEVLNKEIHFNYVIGYTDGTIRPDNNISRAEVATIFFRLLTDEAREQYTTTAANFTDVKDGMWCNRAIATLTNMGIIKGYTDGSFRPNAQITRAELATIIARFAKLDVNTKTFSDVNGHWAQKNIELAAGNGWINGYTDGTFRPNNNITRAETFAMINRVLDRQTESVSDLLPTSEMNMWSDNMDADAWYYKDVQEATNYHKCDRVGDSVYEKWTEKVPDIDWASYQI